MNEAEKYICQWVSKAVTKNWDKIDTHVACIEETREEFIDLVGKDVQTAIWFFQECRDWGYKGTLEDFEYLNPDVDDLIWIYKLGDKIVKLTNETIFDDYKVSWATAKTKTISHYV